MSNDIVVAHYREDLRWLEQVASGWDIYLYTKCDAGSDPHMPCPSSAMQMCAWGCLPNAGREPHTFLTHIVRNYDRLADVTVFVQGNPFDHCPELLSKMNEIAGDMAIEYGVGAMRTDGFRWLGDTNYSSDENAQPYDNRPVGEVAKQLGLKVTFPCYFARGGQFAVTRDRIRARPKEFYEQALYICTNIEGAPWCFERLWGEVFK